MQSYNLIDQPWITCLMKDGSVREVGIHECLARAPDIAEITDPSPLIVVSLHRLLLAILHRNFGPENHATWGELWEKGHWDTRVVDAYLEEWRDRFDLLHPDRPFYQVPATEVEDRKLVPVSALSHYHLSDKTSWFNHQPGDGVCPHTLATAARLLIMRQAYSFCGWELGKLSDKVTPLLGRTALMMSGRTLAETLLLNLLRYDPEDAEPVIGTPEDAPIWEQDLPGRMEERPIRGYLDYLTWQNRRIWLEPPSDASYPMVLHAKIDFGVRPTDELAGMDPMLLWQTAKKADGAPYTSPEPREDKALWRDAHTLLASTEEVRPPRVRAWVGSLVARGVVPPEYHASMTGCVHLACRKEKKAESWRHERFPLPLRYLTDADLAESLDLSLGAAEDAAQVILAASWRLATVRLDPTGTRSPDRAEVDRLITGFPAQRLYWSRLEAPFHQFVLALPTDRDAALAQWRQTLWRTATRSFDEAAAGLEGSTDNLRATVAGRAALRSGLRKALAALDVSDHREETVTHGAI
jgi:CRISPR system Cascade subunit CasA